MAAITPLVSLERRGHVAVLVVDNPPVNALSHGVRLGLRDGLHQAAADADVRAVVIACAGRTFIAGADITEFGKPPKDAGAPRGAGRHRGEPEAGGRGDPRHRARRRARGGAGAATTASA